MDYDFLLFSPYFDKVTRVSWSSFPSIWLLPSDGTLVIYPYIILVSMETECYTEKPSPITNMEPVCDSTINHKPKYCYKL